jgi:tRNA-2-methylthio-N6-dimethylallyladenosine synthase
VQSGSDRILAAMNRRHTRADYLAAIARMRAARPDMAFSSDFIVGFPGESEEDVDATLTLVGEVGYAGAFSFKYSARPGTPAADMPGQIAEEVKSARLYRLQAAIDREQATFSARCLGRRFDVLFEKPGRHPGQIVGRSPYLQPVVVAAPQTMIGQVASVTISEVSANSLFGALAEARAIEPRPDTEAMAVEG